MSGLEWILGTTLAVIYIFCIFTVCAMTFQKGHVVLGWLGIFLPFLWFIGAMLPDRSGVAIRPDRSGPVTGQMT